jgi:hypothetical protein
VKKSSAAPPGLGNYFGDISPRLKPWAIIGRLLRGFQFVSIREIRVKTLRLCVLVVNQFTFPKRSILRAIVPAQTGIQNLFNARYPNHTKGNTLRQDLPDFQDLILLILSDLAPHPASGHHVAPTELESFLNFQSTNMPALTGFVICVNS